MPTTRRSRRIAAPAENVWEVVCDPHHLARWWPRVTRVEAVSEGSFTEVLTTDRGRALRADFRLVASEPGRRICWAQELEGTPFARVLRSSETAVELRPEEGSTEVTIELRQSLNGFFSRFGGFLVRRAARSTLDEALDGLVRIVG
jgi:uncharacterized protein YndB with AHSA1/START domain